jgi:hypothetical protein
MEECRLTATVGDAVRTATETDDLTLAGAIDQFARRGFTENLAVVENGLRISALGKTFRADEVVVRDYRRFEGVSDPDDMSIVYAIEASGGIRGTLVDAYGVYADPAISAFLSNVRIQTREAAAQELASPSP